MKKSPIKFKGAGINLPSQVRTGPPQQEIGPMQTPGQTITPQAAIEPPPTNVRTKEQYNQEQNWSSGIPEFNVDQHNDAIRNATTDAFGSKVYGPGAQFGSRRMGRDKTLSYDKAQTQQFNNYGTLGGANPFSPADQGKITGMFNENSDIGIFENQNNVTKMAHNKNIINDSIVGEKWKKHQSFTGSGFDTPSV